ncbi:MAG: hypothetical protein MUP82_01725, partial [Candidatus Marinimicrobia bacterium]|nr:hypothetical protein [Candidatus Neomarinimicrobiota bacterium]
VVLAPESSSSSLNPMSILGDLGFGPMTGGNENVFRYLAILKSRSIKELMLEKFDLKKHYKLKYSEIAIKKLDKNLNFEVGDEFQVEISMYDKNQDLVAEMTNYVVHCLDSLNIELSVSNARNNRIFMGKRVNSIMDSLEFVGQNLANFMKLNGILNIEDQVTVGVEQAAFLKSTIIQTEVELEVALKSYGSDNPKVNLLRFQLQSLNAKYNDFIGNNTVESFMPNFREVPDLQLKLIKMQRQAEYYTRLIEYLGPLYEQQKFEEAKNIPTLQVLDYAVRPELKAKPKRATIVVLVFILSGLLAVSYVVIKESSKS